MLSLTGFIRLLKLQYSRWLSVALIIGVVPVVMMWHVLFIDQSVHLANPGPLRFASAVTDLDGAARFAYLLSDMTFPWSHTTFISSPTGASIWRLETFSQLLQTLFLWLSVKLVPPMLAANLLIFLGWYGTGVVVYLIFRRCGGSKWIALACVFAVQLLPSMRFMAANFTSYVAVGIPLLVILATVIYFQNRTTKNLLLIFGSLLINGLYDPYWFMFSAYGVTIVIFILAIIRAIKQKSVQALGVAIGVVTLYLVVFQGFSSYITSRTTSGNSREITSGDVGWIRSSLLSVDGWSSSVHMGVGLVVFGLGILALVAFIVFRRKLKKELVILIFIASFVVLSTSISLPLNLGKVELAVNLRNLMPGVRFFDRAALIVGPLILIFLCLVVEKIIDEKKSNRDRFRALTVLLVLLLPLSFPGVSIAKTSNSYNDWREIRNQLNEVPNPRLLALPFNRVGRDWIEQASFQFPILNDLTTPTNDLEVIRQLSHGPQNFAAHVSSLGGTHVLVARTDLMSTVKFDFELPHFKLVGSILLDGFSEGPFMIIDVFEVIAQEGDSACSNCFLGDYLDTEVAVVGDYVNPPDIHNDDSKSWWISGDITKISVSGLGRNVTSIFSQINFNVTIAPCLNTQEFVVLTKSKLRKYTLGSDQMTINISVDGSEASDDITIRSFGSPCLIDTDPRPLKIQLSGLNIK